MRERTYALDKDEGPCQHQGTTESYRTCYNRATVFAVMGFSDRKGRMYHVHVLTCEKHVPEEPDASYQQLQQALMM